MLWSKPRFALAKGSQALDHAGNLRSLQIQLREFFLGQLLAKCDNPRRKHNPQAKNAMKNVRTSYL
jgi:hypothetical protein